MEPIKVPRHVFAVENEQQLHAYQRFAEEIEPQLESYLCWLREHFAVRELPRAIVWTSAEVATHAISDIPVPAYTNDYRTVMVPELDTWREIFLRQFDALDGDDPQIAQAMGYYREGMGRNKVLQILGHEFAHHSDWFPDDDREDGIWFEEGMVEYISRKYFLTQAEFDEEERTDRLLVERLTPRYGGRSLEQFGAATYEGDYASIFFEYWRSFLAVKELVGRFGSVNAVFDRFRQWTWQGGEATLEQWFGL